MNNTPRSYWLASSQLPTFPKLDKDIEVDVAIVGAGIAGITSAYLLVNAGLKVAVIEASRILNGTTGHTTAKITAQHGLIYDEFINHFGKSKARLYYEASTDALHFIRHTVEDLNISCDFHIDDAYIFATTEEGVRKLEKEASAYRTLKIDGTLVDTIPFQELNVKKALVMKKQAQFHPLHYLKALVSIIAEKGGQLYEQTTAVNVETGPLPTVLTRDGKRVKCTHVLACSHFPFYEGLGFYFTRLKAERSYVLCVKATKPYRGGMYINAESPTRSLRSVRIDGSDYVLVGGESHKTGQGEEMMNHYKALEQFAKQLYGDDVEIAYRWSAQDLTTLDKLPYIGQLTTGNPNILIATGFRKWGMTNGTIAALLLADKVLGKNNRYEKLFSPSRFFIDPSLKNFFAENVDVAKHLLKGKLEIPKKSLKELAHGEGAVIDIKGERKGAYKDENGEIYIVDTTCTHIGCELVWNDGERTWDCPCHGSRFSYTGEVIEGPAEKPLRTHDVNMLDVLFSDESGY